jgi:hypothetical protein
VSHALLILAQFPVCAGGLRKQHVKTISPIPNFLTVIHVLADSLPTPHDRTAVVHDVFQNLTQFLRTVRVTVFKSIDADEDHRARYAYRQDATAPNGKHVLLVEAWFVDMADKVNQKIAADQSDCA